MVSAIRVHRVGGPEVLTFEEVDLPPPGSGEVRVRQNAVGVNYIDTYFRTGQYKAPQLPFTLGNEAAGVITALGEGVSGFRVGDRVSYFVALGCYASERNVAAASLVRVPEGVSDELAAAITLKGLTAEYLLRRTHRVQPGDTVLIHAAAGGVGQMLVQWAKHLGAVVIGTVGTDEKAAIARDLGCDHVILYRQDDVPARVRDITDGRGCDVVYDGVGKDTLMASLDSLKPLGLLASFGSASGPIQGLDLGILAAKGSLFVTRPTLATFAARRDWLDEMAANLFEVVGSGIVKVSINKRAPLKDAADVHRALEGRETTGATILLP